MWVTKSRDTYLSQLLEIFGHHPQDFTDDYTVAQRGKQIIQGKKYNLPCQEVEGKSNKPNKQPTGSHQQKAQVLASPLSLRIPLRGEPRPSTVGRTCGAAEQGLHPLGSPYAVGKHEGGLINRCKRVPGSQATRGF